MKRIKIIAGIAWAFAGLILIIILFPGLNSFSGTVSKLPFMKIHPRYTGGEVANQRVTNGCTLNVRNPVFKGLISDRERGFVQVDWRGTIPEKITDTIDYNSDGKPDFTILIDRKEQKTKLSPISDKVKEVDVSTPTSYGWSVRVSLEK